MWKKLIAVFTVTAVLLGVFFTFNPFWDNDADSMLGSVVLAGEYREGFLLTPLDYDSTGVSLSCDFRLESENDITIDEIRARLKIDGQEAPEIKGEGENTFLITPAENFLKNKLYTFRIKRDGGNDVTWTFQTSAPFMVTGSLPGNRTTYVPVDTGIEIYLSHTQYEDLDKYFEISPSVKGKFERHKNAYVFVPDKPLEYGTLYTVTINKGVSLQGSGRILEEDYVFQFETAPDTEEQNERYKHGYIWFNRVLNEYTPRENALIPVRYYYYNRDDENVTVMKVNAAVYGYKDIDSFLEALDEKSSGPVWAYYNYMNKNNISTKGLQKVLEFEHEFPLDSYDDKDRYLKIPQNLPEGYYLVEMTWEDQTCQTFIQVTDMGIYMTNDDENMLIWINDLKTKEPVENADIILYNSSLAAVTGKDGTAFFEYDGTLENTNGADSGERYFKITSQDGKNAVLRYYDYDYSYYYDMWWYRPDMSSDYWRYIQLDRELYKPDDTVSFWGFIQNRYEDEEIGEITAEITQGSYYPFYKTDCWYCFPYFGTDAVAKVDLDVKNGSFDGSINLPNLEPGGYQLQIKKDDKIISSTYINVENYVKPAYKLEVEKDKEAVFSNEKVTFTVKASFYEGTKVPELDVNYNFNFYYGNNYQSNLQTTDSNGTFKAAFTPGADSKRQGVSNASFNCYASLPESGEIYANDSVRVFINDINVDIKAAIDVDEESKERTGKIDVTVNEIVLDRLNDGTALDSSDYLGDAVKNKVLKGKIIEKKWVKYENGTYYDFINKKVVTRYNYKLESRIINAFTIKTDAEGKGTYEFDAPEIKDGYYTFELSTTDNDGKEMNFERYIGQSRYYSYSYIDDSYKLEGVEESYNVGDTVSLEYKKGLDTIPEDASYMYIKSQNGIREYETADSPYYSFGFNKSYAPNINVTGVYFNGITYVDSGNASIKYNYEEKELILKAELDKESYEPGDEAVIKLSAEDLDGNPVKSIVNAGIVDEALFSLNNQYVDTLSSLYAFVPSGIKYSYATHVNSQTDLQQGYYGGIRSNGLKMMADGDDAVLEEAEKSNSNYQAAKAAPTIDEGSVNVRSEFKDTALFKTVVLDDNGKGEIKFTLPDNITAWRVTLSGISTKLDAGSDNVELKVTLPFFINHSMNDTYLTGDIAYVGVTAYGNDLEPDDIITFNVYASNHPDDIEIKQAKAFERVNIPIPKIDEGTEYVRILAQTEDQKTDGTDHYINVVDTYHEITAANYYDLAAGMDIKGGTGGNTTLMFIDKGRGMYYPSLMSLLWSYGNRIEQKLPAQIAGEMILEYFDKEFEFEKDSSFSPSEYQTYDGGMAILPYGSSDLELSAKLAKFVSDEVDEYQLKQYFYTVYANEEEPGLKASALYGLAILKEPVLIELDKISKVNNASINDLLYTALAFCELGEEPRAKKLYDEKIAGKVVNLEPLSYIDTGNDKDDILKATALGMQLLAKLDNENAKSMYQYCVKNRTTDILLNLEMLSYIDMQIKEAEPAGGSFKYTYMGETKEVELEKGRMVKKEIPSANLNGFEITDVKGDIGLISVYKDKPEGFDNPDENISVKRSYYTQNGVKTNTFSQDEVVKVRIEYDFNNKALEGSYEITDFLPSGLKPIENTWIYGNSKTFNRWWYGRIDGQKITFYVYNYQDNESKEYDKYDKDDESGETDVYEENKNVFEFYARVVSPGTYIAESTIIQSRQTALSINTGKRDVITIK